MLNIGWTIGPPLGTLLVMQASICPSGWQLSVPRFPCFSSNLGKAQRENHRHGNRQCLVPKVLLQDKALLWFTCSGFLALLLAAHLLHAFHNM